MRKLSTHAEWLRLVEISGPFLSTTMLERAFPQGLEAIDTPRKQKLRSAYDEWQDANDENDQLLEELHREWVRLVLVDILEYDREVLIDHDVFGTSYSYKAPESTITFSPDYAVKIPGDERPLLFVSIQPPGTDLEKVKINDGWPVPVVERMTLLCRSTGVRIGLVTNGERWMLVNAPVGSTSSHTSWYSRLWFQEPLTLKAFLSLFGVRRCYGPADETLDALLEESLKQQGEVTDTLGEQVRRAVEVLIQCLDKADQDRNRELLHDVSPAELYEAGLTIMMRLVFVLCAEERGLLLLDDPVYDQNYAISSLRSQLAEDADRHGPEVLDRRHDAWARLLAVFRAIYGGIEHETLRMPALGGSLFDPDRFPFLEGRAKGTKWRNIPAAPLPIDNRTVLLLLEALQVLEQPGGALLLSYKALDVENIGHVYEGLLEHTVARVPELTLGLIGSQKAKNPNITLRELEDALASGKTVLQKLLFDVTQRSESAIRNGLTKNPDDNKTGRVLSVCGGDVEFAKRILPFVNLLRTDAWDDPIIYRSNSFMVTIGADRRDTGTHYTPKSLTESIVTTTLEPLVYIGPAEGKPREEWTLKSTKEILDLKVCDPTMGSGAFLVQACRYLGDKLLEAWLQEEAAGKIITVDGEVLDKLGAAEPLPSLPDERLTIARRLVAERCLYGVDVNQLAVELAKLSIWLVTLAKGRPFGFLDHNLRSGDSLLGIHRLEQLTRLRMDTESGQQYQLRMFGQNVEAAVNEAIELRKRLRTMTIRDIKDVEVMSWLDREARRVLESVELIADALIGEALRCSSNTRTLDRALDTLATMAGDFLRGNEKTGEQIARLAKIALAIDLPVGKVIRNPFHWILEFPEVFEHGGFDGIVGNPPFLGGKRITGITGTVYRDWLVSYIANGKVGSADLVAYFFLRIFKLLRCDGHFGLLAVNTIAEGDTRQVGIEEMLKAGAVIHAAYSNETWPGAAAVITSRVHVRKGMWIGPRNLNGSMVQHISAFMSEHEEQSLQRLKANSGISFIGSVVNGMGFILTPDEAQHMIEADPKNSEVIYPYLNGSDLNSEYDQRPSRFVINFWDWNEDRAKEYSLPYNRILELVKPIREKLNRAKYRDRWWHYSEAVPNLYHTIGFGHQFEKHPEKWNSDLDQLEHVLVVTRVSKTLAFSFVRTGIVFSDATVVFSVKRYRDFALLQSSIHAAFAWQHASRLKHDLRYSPTDAFETFPMPELSIQERLETAGALYHSARCSFMASEKFGLTKLYNKFHTPSVSEKHVMELRDLHREIDCLVALAYGWDDLDLGHGFHEVPYLPENDRVRFTISEPARVDVLRRLSELNRQRYAAEVDKGLVHNKQVPAAKRKSSTCLDASKSALLPMLDINGIAAGDEE